MTSSIHRLFNLEGRTALVTGGSRGLGLQMAQALSEAGASLMLTSRKAADLEESAAQLRSSGIEVQWVAADARDPASVTHVVNETMRHFGKIDILINNAGASWGAPAEDHPLEAWDNVMSLNARSLFLFSQGAARASMIQRRSGRIINIASIAGLGGNSPEMKTIAYNTSKGAAVNFSRALAAEWGAYGITVNAIAPGFFPSKMSQGLLDTLGSDNVARRSPLRRLGDEDDLKGAVLLFASDAGKHITGQVLAVDGGATCVVAA
ncbi:SDR family oxidoreductase [Devosia sp.]|uniref:SDR family oxidoreductase n=1 Tax=Devosia sp. TaxID=1871048 RepID=UPI002FCC0FF6